MNKLKISKLLSAVDTFYKKAGGEPKDLEYAKNLADGRIQSINALNLDHWTLDQMREEVGKVTNQAKLEWDSNLINSDQYQAIIQAGTRKNEAAAAKANTPKTDKPAPKPQAKPAAKPNWWGTPEMMAVVSKIQQFLIGILGKDILGPTGADGKWGPLSQKALRTWLAHSKLPGNGFLDEETLRQLSKHIPEVKAYYTKVFNKDPQLGF